MRLSRIIKPQVIIVAIFLAVVLLVPFETIVVPQWTIHAIDQHGNSVSGVPILESWRQYSFEPAGHEETLTTNDAGYVNFAVRKAKSNLLMRTLRTISNTINPHGSTGPSAWILVRAPYKAASEEPYFSPGKPLAETIVVQRRQN